ncbi:MAG: hypothetical protein ACHQII_06175, partial [Bacteroidia bacterium]
YYYSSLSSTHGDEKYKKGDRIFIEFYPPDPDVGLTIYDKKVPDTLITVPANGWDSIPCYIPYY